MMWRTRFGMVWAEFAGACAQAEIHPADVELRRMNHLAHRPGPKVKPARQCPGCGVTIARLSSQCRRCQMNLRAKTKDVPRVASLPSTALPGIMVPGGALSTKS